MSKLRIPSRTKTANTALLLLSCLVVGFAGGWFGARSQSEINDSKTSQQLVTSETQVIKKVADEVGPSVVSINVVSQSTRLNFFGFAQPVEQQSAGTGTIISKDGYILTNRHVIGSGEPTISVTLSDGTELEEVEITGRTSAEDPTDIAILKIKNLEGKQLIPAKLGDSSKVEVGEKVIAIGNALGQFQNTVTSGIISGYGRSIVAGDESSQESLQNLFQTDAAINQGNSGGPLVSISGEVIGINTAVAAGGAENIGFAIPINDVHGLIKTILATGKFERPYLGVRYVNLTDDYAYEYNLPVKRGAYIAPGRAGNPSIFEDSPAAKAGLKEKDIITKIDDKVINEKNSLTSIIGSKSVGEKVTLTVIRDGQEQTIEATLEAAPNR